MAPQEQLHRFTTIGQEELNKRIIASKPTTRLLHPIPTKLLKKVLPVMEKLIFIFKSCSKNIQAGRNKTH